MAKPDTDEQSYIVVDVMRGVAVGVYGFRRLKDARDYLKRLRKGRNLDMDDVQLFETTIYQSAKQHLVDGGLCIQLSR